MQTQPRFTVVTFVLCALVGLAVISKLLAPYVVAPAYSLKTAQASFLQSGTHEHVRWYPIANLSFQEARRLDRPILLVVGAPWSATGRRMDAAVFNSIPVQKLLDRNFICIRADAVENPDWISAYLPLGRAQLSMSGDFQIWLLDSQARLFDPVAVSEADGGYGDTQFSDELVADLSKLQDLRNAANGPDSTISQPDPQARDLALLAETPTNLLPTLSAYRDSLMSQSAKTPNGGFPTNQHQRLWPDAWLFLLATLGPDVASLTIAELLQSPTRDMLDGGFFSGSRDNRWRSPFYDKVAALNAEMCLLLAQYSAAGTSSTPYARFANQTFDSLTGEFLNSDRVIRPCRIGDEHTEMARSQHASFTPRQLRSLLDGVERDWAQEYLHLRPATNPAMTPFLTDFTQLDSPMFDRVVPKLKGFGPPPLFDREATLATYGTSVARLMQTARILHDSGRLQRARDVASHLDLFRRGVDVIHQIEPSERALPTLVDYLAFADAAMQDFLASSRVVSLEDGAATLRRGLELFGMPNRTTYRMAPFDSPHRVAPDSNTPQICDDTGESANAAVIRLAWTYAQLLDHSGSAADRRLATDLRAKASATVTQYADLTSRLDPAGSMGPNTGGYAHASALTIDDTFVLCAGADPVAMANDFAPKSPFRMVTPVAGPGLPRTRPQTRLLRVQAGPTLRPPNRVRRPKATPPHPLHRGIGPKATSQEPRAATRL